MNLAHKGYRFIVLDGDMSHLNYDIERQGIQRGQSVLRFPEGFAARGIWSRPA